MTIGIVFLMMVTLNFCFGDNGHGIQPWILTPLVNPRTRADITYNTSHHSTPTVIVRTLSVLKGHCRCFEYSAGIIKYNPEKVCKSILVCGILHHIAIMQHFHINYIAEDLLPNPEVQAASIDNTQEEHLVRDQVIQDSFSYSPAVNTSCLEKLLQKDVPSLLLKLQNILCLYKQGMDAHNEALYKEFLKELNLALKDAGCSLDEVLNTKGTLEQITDNAGKVADRLVFEILKIADNLEITGQLLNAVCTLLGETLTGLSNALAGLDINLDLGVKALVGGLLG